MGRLEDKKEGERVRRLEKIRKEKIEMRIEERAVRGKEKNEV